MTRRFVGLMVLWVFGYAVARGQPVDSIPQSREIDLEAVEIFARFDPQPILGFTAAAQTIGAAQIENQSTTTLLPALNSVPGIRMEERSPGSYRLAMRGSLIRSPFGVRNVKIYIDAFPLTDAGGNTYLNLIDPASIAAIHVLKGPDGSLYGANSGGVIRIQPHGFEVGENSGSLLLGGGSFGMFQEQLSFRGRSGERHSFSIDQSFTQSNGYRDHSELDKKTFQTAHKWRYSDRAEFRFLALYTDLNYLTPGGLTEVQLRENRRMSRPGSGPLPSAAEQRAGVHNKTFFGGIAHKVRLVGKLTHSASVFGSHTDFENPFITNYEFRKEKNLGIRTHFSYESSLNEDIAWEMQIGFEGQMGWNRIDNYDNHGGVAGGPQALDQLDNTLSSLFYRTMVEVNGRWTIEASLGLNKSEIAYQTRFPEVANPEGHIDFGNIWMPRIATSYLLTEGWAIRGSVSKGYSPPTIAEVRPSDNRINTDLHAETGLNYEVGMRFETAGRRFIADAAFYNYGMDNGIVRRQRENGLEYFTNAGEIDQNGLEASVWLHPLPAGRQGFLRDLSLHSALAYNRYRFGVYRIDDADFSGNRVTAVPDWVWTNRLDFSFAGNLGLHIAHNYTSEVPLDDANTVTAEPFHLVQIKGTWDFAVHPKFQLRLYAGVDNALDAEYSLGNDFNAFGNRYFNPAPGVNYYGGVEVRW